MLQIFNNKVKRFNTFAVVLCPFCRTVGLDFKGKWYNSNKRFPSFRNVVHFYLYFNVL